MKKLAIIIFVLLLSASAWATEFTMKPGETVTLICAPTVSPTPTPTPMPSPTPTPSPGVQVPITDTIVYGPQNNKVYTIKPLSIQYFNITVPAGQTSSRASLASGSQNGFTQLCIVKTADMAAYLVKTNPVQAWCASNQSDLSGEVEIIRSQTLPGSYYMVVKNLSPTKTVQYYLYWKTY